MMADDNMQNVPLDDPPQQRKGRWKSVFQRGTLSPDQGRSTSVEDPGSSDEAPTKRPSRWSMGVLNDPKTIEVPGSVLLLAQHRNEPLGLRHAPDRTSTSSLPSGASVRASSVSSRRPAPKQQKKTPDGAIILTPQPDDSDNDPLNWPSWRRDAALLTLGFYCLIGGGMTPILAAGFNDVAATYGVSQPRVALTTGLYMMGLGVGSVFASPTAILFGKRPVYLFGALMFVCTCVWCALSPSYASLCVARVFQGIAVSPVECLPSATIAEIFFLHERAYRIGIYTLLLLGGKNLVPLVSAAVIESFGWRWVFWIVAMIAGGWSILLFLFVPETFWDRTPHGKHYGEDGRMSRKASVLSFFHHGNKSHANDVPAPALDGAGEQSPASDNAHSKPSRNLHVGFAPGDDEDKASDEKATQEKFSEDAEAEDTITAAPLPSDQAAAVDPSSRRRLSVVGALPSFTSKTRTRARRGGPGRVFESRRSFESRPSPNESRVGDLSRSAPTTPPLHDPSSPFFNKQKLRSADTGYFNLASRGTWSDSPSDKVATPSSPAPSSALNKEAPSPNTSDPEKATGSAPVRPPAGPRYTSHLRTAPKRSFVQQLKPWNGRLHQDNWFKVAIRPFILYAYPSVLWSAIVYACSVGWLIVISESVSHIYRSKETYNFSALSAGLIYISPFVGGVLGTAVAGKLSDVVVRAMSRRNGGLYEPEFRLVMATPIAITTVIGLMGYGWSAQVHDAWIVPTIFFGIISFGCCLGSTTSITFCVDSYRQYAGEALVTLNFTKNIFHGLVFSLFFNSWLDEQGSRTVFVALGVIQLGLLLCTIPMFIFGKRARMWTVRKNFMEKF